MECPYCNADTKVVRTTSDEATRITTRERRCLKDSQHRIATVEQERISTADIAIHESGSNSVTAYSTKVLWGNLEKVLLAKENDLSDARRIEAIVDVVERRLVRREVPMRRLLENERKSLSRRVERAKDDAHARQLSGIRLVVNDFDLEDAVDSALAQWKETRMERVLYALAVRGRQGGAQHRGWKSADDALDWLLATFPTLARSAHEPTKRSAVRDVFIPSTPDLPRAVVKNSGVREDFDLGRFRRTVEKTLSGREDAAVKVDGVVSSTLHRLAGPRVIRTAQLAVVALDILRATDDVAYLRAAVRWKGLRRVTDIHGEVNALLTHPSGRIRFVAPQVPSMLP